MAERKTEHLQMIQGVVSRLSTNSFLLKGWSVVLVSALFGLSTQVENRTPFLALAYFPALAFWILDAYFLSQERRFRALFDHVRMQLEDKIDFSMSTVAHVSPRCSWPAAFLSRTVLIFHGVVVASIFLVMLLLG